VCAQLRSSVGTALRSREVQQFNAQLQPTSIDPPDQYDHNWTDRTYGGRGRQYGRGYNQRPRGKGGGPRGGSFRSNRQKKCYVCEKPNCWSTRHSLDERKEAYNKFRQSARNVGNREATAAYFQSFLVQYEGVEDLEGEVNEAEQLLMDMEIEDYSPDQYFTEYGEVDGTQIVAVLNDQSTLHSISPSPPNTRNQPRTTLLP